MVKAHITFQHIITKQVASHFKIILFFFYIKKE
jgi:hypothetical protein